jgi:hypothetical protein
MVKVRSRGRVRGRLIARSLRHRDYALLWGGQTVSVLGDGIYTIAIALETLRISDRGWWGSLALPLLLIVPPMQPVKPNKPSPASYPANSTFVQVAVPNEPTLQCAGVP